MLENLESNKNYEGQLYINSHNKIDVRIDLGSKKIKSIRNPNMAFQLKKDILQTMNVIPNSLVNFKIKIAEVLRTKVIEVNKSE